MKLVLDMNIVKLQDSATIFAEHEKLKQENILLVAALKKTDQE